MKTVEHSADLCIVGGGMSGVCAALAAARHGAKVVLMQDRPVLGGNASGEVRMWICGASGEDNRETGILEELEYENYYMNPGLKFPLWDAVLYGKVKAENNITLLLNTTCLDCTMKDGKIETVKGWQLNAETYHVVRAKYFADCSGDSILCPLTGASAMMGREGKDEYGESIAPDRADSHTMGMSCLIQARETDSPKPFIKPDWAYTYETDEDIAFRKHPPVDPLNHCNYWWIEVGGMVDALHDSDACRDECLKIAFGVWDHIKNRGDHGADNWELEWIGFLPGKRESRRYVGKYVINENDVRAEGKFPDVVAYGGWSMDDHFPEGFYYKKGVSTIWHPAPSPWGIPFRALVSKDVPNLLFAGRNISVTHVALSSSRVMATCALLGQAVGTAVAEMIRNGTDPDTVDIGKVQQILLEDDVMLPGLQRNVSKISLDAKCNAPVVLDGTERGESHVYTGKAGDAITLDFGKPTEVSSLRIVFDSDLNRGYWNMPSGYPIEQPKYKISPKMVKDFNIVLTAPDGTENVLSFTDNHQRLVRIPVGQTVSSVALVPLSDYGAGEMRVFAFEAR
ncbi:MAG: FAD-dependent oxidoreductase [Clostridia bacterium]|nr:FAD-dependent oxidoreductase [Clostridia bacterium]